MSSDLPAVSGRKAIAAFEKAGFNLIRTKGSHHILKKRGHRFLLSVPVHANRSMARGTLVRLIKDAGLTQSEFSRLLDQ